MSTGSSSRESSQSYSLITASEALWSPLEVSRDVQDPLALYLLDEEVPEGSTIRVGSGRTVASWCSSVYKRALPRAHFRPLELLIIR